MQKTQLNKRLTKFEMLKIKGGFDGNMSCRMQGDWCDYRPKTCCPGLECRGRKPNCMAAIPNDEEIEPIESDPPV